MKRTFFTLKMLVAVIAVAITFTSCNKDQNPITTGETNNSPGTTVMDTYSGPGATYIGLQMVPNTINDNYFWYGPQAVAGNRQEFQEADFTDEQDFMTVTAENGIPNYHGLSNPRIGVWDLVNAGSDGDLIDDNEVLIFTLGTDIVAGAKMFSASVNLDGGGTASIELYDGVTLVGNIVTTGTGTINLHANGVVFNRIRFSATSGSYGIISPGIFYLVSENYIGVNTLNGTNNRYAYSSVTGNGVPVRQQFDNANTNGFGNGAFLNASPNNQQWLVASSSPGLTTYSGATFSWGVGADSRINVGESMSITKGSSVVKDFVAAAVEYRNATAGAVAIVKLKKFGVTLQTLNISLSASGTLLIHENLEFDEIVFESQTGTWNPVGNPAGVTRLYNTP